MQRLTILFSKDGGARFLSHLDLQSTLEFSIRRARLPIALSEGFTPRPKMSLATALPLGHIGEREILELILRTPVAPEEVRDRLADNLPAGIGIVSVEESPPDVKPAGSRLLGTVYRVELPHDIENLPSQLDALLTREHIEVEEHREDRVRTRDLRPSIESLEAPDSHTIHMRFHFHDGSAARPEQILNLLGIPSEGATLVRERITLQEP